MLNYRKRREAKVGALLLVFLFLLTACSGIGSGTEPTTGPELTPAADLTDPPVNGTTEPTPTPQSASTDSPSDTDPEAILEGYRGYGIIDAPAEDFELEDLDGNLVKLSDFKGKIVFLNFWATWCPPCRDEMPHMQTFYEKYKDEDVVILAVNPNQVENRGMNNAERAEEKVRNFIDEHGFTFPVLLDRDDSVWGIYQQRGIPANYMIDKEGFIKYLKPGAFADVKEMEDFAEALRLSAN